MLESPCAEWSAFHAAILRRRGESADPAARD